MLRPCVNLNYIDRMHNLSMVAVFIHIKEYCYIKMEKGKDTREEIGRRKSERIVWELGVNSDTCDRNIFMNKYISLTLHK